MLRLVAAEEVGTDRRHGTPTCCWTNIWVRCMTSGCSMRWPKPKASKGRRSPAATWRRRSGLERL